VGVSGMETVVPSISGALG
jgi:hypothetical protein